MTKLIIRITLILLGLVALGAYVYDQLHLSVKNPFRIVSYNLRRPSPDSDLLMLDYQFLNESGYLVTANCVHVLVPGAPAPQGADLSMQRIPPGGLWSGSVAFPIKRAGAHVTLDLSLEWHRVGFPPIDRLRAYWFEKRPRDARHFYAEHLLQTQVIGTGTLPVLQAPVRSK